MSFTKTTHAVLGPSGPFTFCTHFRHNKTFHKNDTPGEPAIDTLRGGGGCFTQTASIHTPSCLPPTGAHASKRNSRRHQRSKPVRAQRSLTTSLTIALVLAAPATALGKRLIIGGSTSMVLLVQKLATAYHKAYPHSPAPKVGGCQSD